MHAMTRNPGQDINVGLPRTTLETTPVDTDTDVLQTGDIHTQRQSLAQYTIEVTSRGIQVVSPDLLGRPGVGGVLAVEINDGASPCYT